MSWWETLHLVTWWKRLGISAIKTGQDAPSWMWCTWRLSFFCGGLVFLQCFVHVQSHFQPLPKLILFWPRLIWMVEVTRFASTSKTYDIHEYSSTAFECEPWLPFLLVFLCPAIFFTLRNHCLRPCGLVETQSTAATQSWKEPLLFP